jgi:hypothetical protein
MGLEKFSSRTTNGRRVLAIIKITDEGPPTDEARILRYEEAMRIKDEFLRADDLPLFRKLVAFGRALDLVDAFYKTYPETSF